jgi:hypothetical protein
MLPFKGFCCHQKNVAINDNWMWQKLVPAHCVNQHFSVLQDQ